MTDLNINNGALVPPKTPPTSTGPLLAPGQSAFNDIPKPAFAVTPVPPVTPPAPIPVVTPQIPAPITSPVTPVPPAPTVAVTTPVTPSTSTTPVPTSTTGTSGSTSTTTTIPTLADQADRDALVKAQADFETKGKQVSDTILGLQNGAIPLNAGEQAQLDGLKSQWQTLIDQQIQTNSNYTTGARMLASRNGTMQYAPGVYMSNIQKTITDGATRVASLFTQEASAVATLTQSLKNGDIAAVKDAWSAYKDASKSRTDALQKTIDDTQKVIKEAQDAKIAADKVIYDTVTKPIQDIATEAAKNGADNKIIDAINSATSVTAAVAAAGDSLQTATGQLGDYLQYKRDTTAKGLTPSDYSTWKSADDARQSKLKSSEAYSTAYASAAGKAAAEATYGVGGTSTTPTSDSTAGGVTGAAGISLQAFNYLTQGTASMSRMGAAQRNQIMKEANDFLNRKGLDVSTFQSQYKAYNDVLQKNIARANQTKIMAGEVTSSADALIDAMEQKKTSNKGIPGYEGSTGMGSLKAANILSLLAGGATNNKFAQTYATQLKFMANDLAGYLAAARGASSPELQDQRDAAEIIANGMNTNSTQAFRDAVKVNEEKVATVVNKAANDAQKQVWDLFGVGSQYHPKAAQINPKDAVDTYVKSNPAQANTVASLYEVPGATDQDVLDYINHLNK